MITPRLLLVFALALTACQTSRLDQGERCTLDSDCEDELICTGICDERRTPELPLVLEVIPPSGAGLLTETFPVEDATVNPVLCGNAALELELPADDPTEIFARGTPEHLPGRIEQHTFGPFVSSARIELLPGTWHLVLRQRPLSGLPPPPIEYDATLARCQVLELPLPPPLRPVRELRFLPVVDPRHDPRPRCGIRVTAFDPLDGTPLSQPLAIEQRDSQGFECPGDLPHRLLVQSPREGKVVVLEVRALRATASTPELRLAVELPEGPLADLGALGVVGASLPPEEVILRVEDDAGEPVLGARISATGLVYDVNGQVWESAPGVPARFSSARAQPVVAQPGAYRLELLPGSYAFEVRAPSRLPAARSTCVRREDDDETACSPQVQVTSGEAGEGNHFAARLGPSFALTGRVLDPDGFSSAHARLLVRPWSGSDFAQVSARADSAGDFSIALQADAGYDLLAFPETPGVPWGVLRISSSAQTAKSQTVRLAAAARLEGQVRRAGAGTPLAEAVVRAYRSTSEGQPVLVAEGITAPDGRFELLVPARR